MQSWLAVSHAVAFRWHLRVKEHAAGGWHVFLSLNIVSGFPPVVSLRGQLWASPEHGSLGAAGLLIWLCHDYSS